MRHLLSTKALSREDAIRILDTAEDMAEVASRDVPKIPALRGRTVVNLFFEDSTRTRISFEVAEKRLSADVINFSAKGSSVSKGESLKDTAQTLQAMGADAVVIRHSASGAPEVLAGSGWIRAAVVNAGDGTHEHPTQALLDAFTLRRKLAERDGVSPRGRGLDGASITIVGDILHSRVARSNLWLLTTLGATVRFVCPPTLQPSATSSWPSEFTSDFDAAIDAGQDALMMLRVQQERMRGGFFPNPREYSRMWGLTDERFARTGETIIMHPGPMNRGFEIGSAAADSARSVVLEQVENGVSVRMAVLYELLAGSHETEGEHA